MPYDADFQAIAGNAKKSDAFKKMGGGSEESDEASGEESDLRAAYASAQSDDEDGFVANMLAAIKSCIANYGPVKK